MPVEKKIMLYEYDELPTEKAKEKAREWFLSGDETDLSFTCDSFRTVCGCIGIKLDEKDAIAYELGSSQSDHVVFSGRFAPEPDAVSQIRAEFPEDEKLYKIAMAVEELHRNTPDCIVRLTKHHRSLRISLEVIEGVDDDPVDYDENVLAIERKAADIIEPLQAWFFKSLQETYEDQQSEESVSENIRINNYTFREDGRREDA